MITTNNISVQLIIMSAIAPSITNCHNYTMLFFMASDVQIFILWQISDTSFNNTAIT